MAIELVQEQLICQHQVEGFMGFVHSFHSTRVPARLVFYLGLLWCDSVIWNGEKKRQKLDHLLHRAIKIQVVAVSSGRCPPALPACSSARALPLHHFGFFPSLEEEMPFHTIVFLSDKTSTIKSLINRSLACQGLNRFLKYFMLEEVD